MVFGGMAGSTAGGAKITRINLLTKSSVIKVKNMMSPRKVEVLTQDRKPIDSKTIEGIQSFFVIYIMIFVICTLLISIDNFDIETNLTASLSCISNIGPGLGEVGPYGSFAGYSNFSKLVLSIEMIAGRLELFPLLTLFSPKTWKRNV
jgi:trk system potassium uptake protein TrkH